MSFYVCVTCTNPVDKVGQMCGSCAKALSEPAPVEASGNLRENAHILREMFVSLINEGFTESQAMQMCGVSLSSIIFLSNGNGGSDG